MTFVRMIGKLLRDERGGEVLEYALVAGMISVVAAGPMREVGRKVVLYWRSLDAAMGI